MNKHILLVMKYLDDNNSVTQEELSDSYGTTYDAYTTDDAISSAVATATYAAYFYATTATPDAHYAKNTIDRYFSITGENRQSYLDEIKTNKGE